MNSKPTPFLEENDMGMKEAVQFGYTRIRYMFSESRVTPFGGLLIPGQMLQAVNFDKKIDRYTRPTKEFKNSDILKAMLIGILCGDVDFESIHETDDDPEFFCNAFHMHQLPSEATLRQRLDEIGDTMKEPLRQITVDLFKTYDIKPTPIDINGVSYVPIDIDVSPFINEKCCKEGISKTYKLKDGYAPIFAYIGAEGYLLACELREGKQHCQCGTLEFLKEVLILARKITDQPLLIRMDSGNDAKENIAFFMEECFKSNRVHFIIKRNLRKEQPQEWLDQIRDVCTNVKEPREGKKEYIGQTFRDIVYNLPDSAEESSKTVGIRTIYDITERACDHDGQYYILPKIECDMYSVNIDFADEVIIELYHKHGEMEQYHSEIKTDLNAEQLPSGKFATNELILELIQLAYNMLRMMGQSTIGMEDLPVKRTVKRRRLRTVVTRLIMAPGVITRHARQVRLDLGRSNPWRKAVAVLLDKFMR